MELMQVTDPAQLSAIAAALQGLARRFPMVDDETIRLAGTVTAVHAAALSITPDSAQGDLRLFLAAESARDVLAAPRMAESIFRRIAEQWPTSPYAPKAILAAQQLNPGWVDSARALLEGQYFDSPYLAVVRGEATPEYRQLEDSLGAFAASLAAARPAGDRRARPGPVPSRRPQPAPESGGSKVPEPN
jgi:hypothetical protein